MTLPPLAYVRPATIDEAAELLLDPAARPLAGGQSLVPGLAAARATGAAGVMTSRSDHTDASVTTSVAAPTLSTLVDLSALPGLDSLMLDGDVLRIGALVTQRTAERAALVARHVPLLAQALAEVGHPSIRNRGTVVGSLLHADPAAEVPAVATALDSTVVVAGPRGARRELAVADLLAGPQRTTLALGELVVELRLPIAADDERHAWLEFAPRRFDLPLVGAAVRLALDGGARLTLAGVGPTPMTVPLGVISTPKGTLIALEEVLTPLAPPTDARASGALRRHLARTLALRALAQAAASDGAALRASPAATAVPTTPAAPTTPPAPATSALSVPLALTVDGDPAALQVDARETLAETLRDRLGVLGVRVGCAEGQCGSCTVSIDGRTARSCTVLAAQADGAHVETVEGLARPDEPLAPLQQAFVEEHGLQCGFCTAGMLMTARELLREDPRADDDAIRAGLAGNLCRCTGYQGIVRAVRRARDELQTTQGDRDA